MKCFKEHMKLCMLALMCILFLGVGIRAEAAPGTVTGLEQEDGNDTIAVVQWDAPLEEFSEEYTYRLEWCSRQDFVGASSIQCGNSACMITDLTPGSTYYVRVFAVDKDGNEGEPSAIVEVVTAPQDTQGIRQTAVAEKKITFSWESAAGADEYEVAYQKVDAKDKPLEYAVFVNTAGTSYSISTSADSRYMVAVYPIKKSSTGYEARGNSSKVVTMYTMTKRITKITAKGRTLNGREIQFDIDLGEMADGCEYEVYGSNGKRILKKSVGSSKIGTRTPGSRKGGSVLHVPASKIKKGQFVKIRVRSYMKTGGRKKVSKWSNYYYFAEGPEKVNKYQYGYRIDFSWSPVKGADSYTIYTAKDSQVKKWKKVVTTSKTKYTLNLEKRPELRSSKERYYKVIANKKVKGKTWTSTQSLYYIWLHP